MLWIQNISCSNVLINYLTFFDNFDHSPFSFKFSKIQVFFDKNKPSFFLTKPLNSLIQPTERADNKKNKEIKFYNYFEIISKIPHLIQQHEP